MKITYKKAIMITTLLLTTIISGCVRLILPTSESQLLAQGKSSTVIANTDVVTAFSKLKYYTQKCVAYRHNDGSYVQMTSHLDREQSTANLTANVNFGTYLFKITLVAMDENKTKITYTHAKSMLMSQKLIESIAQKYKLQAETYNQGDKCI